MASVAVPRDAGGMQLSGRSTYFAKPFENDTIFQRDECISDAWCDAGTSDFANECFDDVVHDDVNCDYDDESDEQGRGVTDDTNADLDFVMPIEINGLSFNALRDSCNFGSILVDKKLVPENLINYDRTVACIGAFDNGKPHRLPTAKITMKSPFGTDREVVTTPRSVPNVGLFSVIVAVGNR